MATTFLKLTRPSMRKLLPGEKLTEHGITFERLDNRDGVFTVNVMVDGQRIHRVVGRESDGTTRSQAEEFIAKVRTDAKHDRLALPKGRKVALSFRAAAGKYLERLEQEGGKNIAKKKRQLELHLVPFFGDTPLTKIAAFDVERYKKHRQGQPAIRSNSRGTGNTYKEGPAAPGTINRELAALSHLFTKAVEWGWITHRPATIKRLREDSGRITYLTVEQAKRLIESAAASDNSQIHPFIVIGLETSMRMMEILSIRKENVDVDRRLIYIPKAKGGARSQPITAHLAKFLASYIEGLPPDTAWLFPSPVKADRSTGKTDRHTVNIRTPYRRAVKAAGLDPDQVVRHTMRHTAISHLVQAGVDLPTVKRISGHKTLAMVERYAHANGEHIQAAMDKLEKRYRDIEGR